MKKNLTTIILAVVTLYGYGHNLAGTFLPRANDEICRQTVTFSVAGEAGTDHQLTLDCHALRHGEYILYLSVNGQVTSQKVSL